ncbi:uncharacterized protein si:ch1073-456m8.1 isoform X2 [Trichomycterus rosablanca]|uniref:uncharacterized protein si:ch1073-456m8.1 isoform X2 n=1 Tax=Trichomycterus rosablanca TaxID=2290929 RepID=UPI002F352691
MHSDTVDKSGSPRKRISSRGMSEEESLRHLIQEAEETPKRLLRRDSRYGSLRRGDTRGSQSEEDSVESTAMMELQADYEACLEELRSVERHQDVLLFQLDCLHDTLEGAEEALADTRRENKQLSTELEHEKEQRRKLEVTIASLVQEVEQLKEERNSFASTSVREKIEAVGREEEVDGNVSKETVLPSTDLTGSPAGSSAGSAGSLAGSAAAYIAGKFVISLSKYIKAEPNPPKPDALQLPSSTAGTSVDHEVTDGPAAPPSDQASVEHGAEDNDESSGYEDAPSDFSPGSATPDGLTEPGLPDDGENELISDGTDPKACLLS